VAEIAEVARIYRRLVGARIRGQLQYRLSFALNLLGSALTALLDFVAILILFSQVDALGGWSVWEVALLYAISSVSFGITDLVIGHIDLLPRMIREGDFDQLLLRPLGSLFQVVAADFTLRRLGKVVQGLAVLLVAAAHVDVDWTAGRVGVLMLAVVAGAFIFAGVWIALATIAFWLIDSQEVANSFTYGGNYLAQYPINIFGPWLRRLVVVVIPIAFVAYFPSLYVLGKEDELGLPRGLQFVSPLVAVVTAIAAGLLWRTAVRRYRSVGA
jgi:viologen exporter family transport system permease protein